MRWKKLGKIFDPAEHKLPNNCVEFAQSPQTLAFDDFVRIYFSTRQVDKNGKFLSHISYVDFDKSFKNILGISSKPVIELGKLGTFDEHGIFPINIVRDKNRILAYTCGWSRRVSVSVETSTGFAESFDNGETFTKLGDGPVFSSSLNEPFLVGDSFVLAEGEKYHMWYIYGNKWFQAEGQPAPDRVYKIAYASSSDGINWNRDGKCIVPDKLHENECQALPSVIKHNNIYHMFFCYRDAVDFRTNKEKAYRIGYAHSNDLKNWVRDDLNSGIDVSESGWDSDMQCYPHIFRCDDKIYLLYNGNQFGRNGFGLAVLEE
jgi:hypothetical protein